MTGDLKVFTILKDLGDVIQGKSLNATIWVPLESIVSRRKKNPEAETRNVNDMESSFMRNTRILSCGVIFK